LDETTCSVIECKSQIMSQPALLNLPVQFTYKPNGGYEWKIRKNGELVIARNRGGSRRGHWEVVDPWSLRASFIKTENTKDAVSKFLNETLWFEGPFYTFKGFCRWQQFIRRALELPSDQWSKLRAEFSATKVDFLFGGWMLVSKRVEQGFVANILAEGPMHAIVISVQIDQLRKAQFKVCARPDCRVIFEVTSRHNRFYCSQSCAHTENIRRLRSAKRNNTDERNGSAIDASFSPR